MGDKAAIDLADSLRVNQSLTHLCWDENFVALGECSMTFLVIF